MTQPGQTDAHGLASGAGAYFLWGLLPLYFPLIAVMGPLEIAAHRVVWTLVFMLVVVTVLGWRRHLAVWRNRGAVGLLALAAILIGTNWVVLVLAVNTGHTVDAALGYFINPIFTVALAVIFLGERLRPVQWVALVVSAVAVVVIWAGMGRFPWIALVLAGTFAFYGLTKNRVGKQVQAFDSLTVETVLLLPFAVGYLAWLTAAGRAEFVGHGVGHMLIVAASGLVTGVPFVLFGASARRIPLAYIGLLQYISPIMQFLIGVVIYHEAMPTARWVGFALVWVAVVLLVIDGLNRVRRLRRLHA